MIAEQFLVSHSKRTPLRIGILLDSLFLPRCYEQLIADIQRSNFVKVELLIVRDRSHVERAEPHRSKWGFIRDILSDPKRRKHLAFTIYHELDKKYFMGANDPYGEIDCTEKLRGIESLTVTPIVKGFVHRFSATDIEEIRKRDLDVILRFGFNILHGEILRSARYGIWSYHRGDNDFYRGGPPHFWELYEQNKLTGVMLQVLTEELDAGLVLTKALFSTEPSGISTVQNRFTPSWGSTHLLIQKLYELHNYGWEHLQRNALLNKPYQGKRKIYCTPTNWELCRWLIPALAAKSVRLCIRASTREKTPHWRIGVRTGSHKPLYESDPLDYSGFHWLTAPKGHFQADPFLIEDRGRTWLFFEDYIYREGKAVIACREVLENGEVGDAQTVLQRPYHLSYPFVFKHCGAYYLIPESARNHTVELYRATEFPFRWSPEKVLYRGKAVDTTVFIDSNTFWFFTTLKAPMGEGTCLCLFYSDKIDGEWNWHPANPLSMDVRDARCGGRVFRHNEKLIRISQDCSGRYGSSFSFREISTLSRTDYQENLLCTVKPWSKSFWGTHTYDHCDGTEVVDAVGHAHKSSV